MQAIERGRYSRAKTQSRKGNVKSEAFLCVFAPLREIFVTRGASLINLAYVFFNHAVAVVLRGERLNGALHHRNPLSRQSRFVAMVKDGHNFQLQRAIERLRV